MARPVLWVLVLLFPVAALAAVERAVPGYQGQTRDVITLALQNYRSLQSYQDKLVIKTEVEIDSQSSPQPPNEQQKLTLAFARPNRIALTTPVYGLFSDGDKIWQHLTPIEQYLQSKAPGSLDLDSLSLNQFAGYHEFRHPIADVLTQKDATFEELFGKVVEFTGITGDSLEGKLAYRISGQVEIQVDRDRFKTAPFEAWFNKDTGLLEGLRADYTELAKANNRQIPIKKYVRQLRFEEIISNQTVPTERFVFKPGTYDEKMNSFLVPVSAREMQRKLIGRPAPDFKGRDFQGRDFSLSSLRGQVVILDFWSLRCGPCIMAMPQMQKLSEKYAGKPVSLVGINSDGPGARSQIDAILKRNKVTFRQFMDHANEAFHAYRVEGIPCLFLIDKNGIVQTIHTGFSFGETQLLAHEIDKLLKGESLVK